MKPVVLIMGPTASGKTGLSLQLAAQLAARGQGVEIISVDSAQVFREMDIGTAKPDAAQRAQLPHHLIDICDPAEAYSAARFAADARRLIDQIHARGNLPLLVGGTMLYFRALTVGLSDLPTADPALRARLSEQAKREGWPALHAQLLQLDPTTAARLHPNDGQRVQRALEVILTAGQPLSELQGASQSVAQDLHVLKFAIAPVERAALHERIAARLQVMMGQGFVEEVRRLHARGDLHPEMPAMRAVGYRQIWAHLEGAYDEKTAQQKALEATRQFAKRQITWLRSEHDLCWLNSDDADAVYVALRRIDEWMPETPC